jgi:hypothetical protein
MTRIVTVTLSVALWLGVTIGCGGSSKNPVLSGSGGSTGAGGNASGGGGSGGTSGTAMGSGVDGTKLVSALTTDEKGKMCDYFAMLVGGYGMSNTCGMGSFYPPTTKDDCVNQFSICDAKVSDYEACNKAQADAQKTCTDASFMTANGTSACKAVLMAGC